MTSSLRMNVRSGSYRHGVNRPDDVCYRVLLMSTLLLYELGFRMIRTFGLGRTRCGFPVRIWFCGRFPK
ncbi:hypothetical protein llap_7197 [Limosa lapponica baueri]|uniref:Uncharacterized protein n=1 Tax=Limosa lapponica baueri TaxID=1758121 RepID=A0A2I0U8V3_LIMLA|nr:hypothetical protein llap_7197 [Limosa lapponica baueri]